jgi:hypothetical protein
VDHRCGIQRNRSSADHIICIRPILEEKWRNNEAVHQLFLYSKQAYDSVRREVLYDILELCIPMNLVRLKISVSE